MNKLVYLAGPITGKSFSDSTDWRAACIEELAKHNITGRSPLRAKEYLKNELSIKDSYEDHPLSSQRGITTRDRFDTTRADLVIANFLNTDRVSIGTVIEVAWADLARIPVILVIEKIGNLHDHAMLREIAGYRVDSLEDATKLAIAILK